jgi:hypothetical protein
VSDRRYRIREDCRGCGSRNLDVAVKLKPLPLVSPNVGVTPGEAGEAARVAVPADLHLCRDCGLLQLTAVIDPAFQYNRFKYVTTISVGLPEHFRAAAGAIISRGGLEPVGRVVEIGSNDGTLLRAFGERGWQVLGIDPAEGPAEVARTRGVPTLARFFDKTSAREILGKIGRAGLVIANNTLANIDDLDEMMRGLDVVLDDRGIFVFETSYGAEVVRRTLLDTIYHEHLSYFMVKPLAALFARHRFELFDVREIATKGGSLRGFVQRAGGERPVTDDVARLIAGEEADGLYAGPAYARMAAAIADKQRQLRNIIDSADRNGQVAAYGASVGCAALISQFGLAKDLACVFDDQRLLDAISGPDYEIPVVASEEIYVRRPELIVILAWRYADLIMRRHCAFTSAGGRFVVPLPQVTLQ